MTDNKTFKMVTLQQVRGSMLFINLAGPVPTCLPVRQASPLKTLHPINLVQ
jgi:hypothetical protein